MGALNYSGKVNLGVNAGKVIIGNQRATVKFVGGTAPDNLGNHIATTNLNMSGFRIENLGDPIYDSDAVTKDYVDSSVSGAISGLDAGDGLGRIGNIIYVGEGVGIKTWPDLTSVDELADFGWSGTHNHIGPLQLSGTTITASATEINQALDGISGTVTATALNTLTNGQNIGMTQHWHDSTNLQSVSGNNFIVTHDLAHFPVFVQCFLSGTDLIEPQEVSVIDLDTIYVTFGKDFVGTIFTSRGH